MKKMELSQMENLNGGSLSSFTTGFCGGIAVGSGILLLTGAGAPLAVTVLGYAGAACGGLALFGI